MMGNILIKHPRDDIEKRGCESCHGPGSVYVPAMAEAMGEGKFFALSFNRAEQLDFCASCHTMTPWVADLKNPNSSSLASKHYRNRWIVTNQCYTCHVNYGFMGPIGAKLDGMRHMGRLLCRNRDAPGSHQALLTISQRQLLALPRRRAEL